MADPILDVRDLSVAAGERPVLRGVSLSMLPGEVHVLLGPNGSGKTTLLLAIMGCRGAASPRAPSAFAARRSPAFRPTSAPAAGSPSP